MCRTPGRGRCACRRPSLPAAPRPICLRLVGACRDSRFRATVLGSRFGATAGNRQIHRERTGGRVSPSACCPPSIAFWRMGRGAGRAAARAATRAEEGGRPWETGRRPGCGGEACVGRATPAVAPHPAAAGRPDRRRGPLRAFAGRRDPGRTEVRSERRRQSRS